MAKLKKRVNNRKKGKTNFFKENYRLSLKYIKESKSFIYFSALIFFAVTIIGFFYPVFFRQEIISYIKELVEQTQNLGQFELIKFIFLNNMQGSFVGLIFGILLGFFPLLFLIINGYVLGFVASLSVDARGFSVLLKLIPHGIFELPAVFISMGLGIKLSSFIFEKNKIKNLKDNFINSLRVFLFVIIPLLIIAAIIEGMLIPLFG